MEPSERVRKYLAVSGIVQGVGFRPFVHQLAARHGLAGWVLNDAEGVKIEVEGPWEALNRFVHDLQTQPPPLARITELKQAFVPVRGDREFKIIESQPGARRRTLISPDTNVCADCRRELFDPADRHYRYPFVNCTNCGPRYTIIRDIPYDRPNTTMRAFPMCADCRREYDDPADRRFHAQPVACPACGPKVELWDAGGTRLDVPDPIGEAAARLRRGEIVAVKGLGGFHLACDASNEAAVRALRQRKHREEKPFAVMSNDLDAVTQYAELNAQEAELLLSFRRPIVLLRKRLPERLAPGVAPKNRSYGIMLPCTPIQYLLFDAGGFLSLVMTSGNQTDEPICIDNGEAVERLRGIADAFLVHDRGIHARVDDSIARVMAGEERVQRRARGYVPLPVLLHEDGPAVLAVGAELKGALCLAKERNAFLSQHLGDLKSDRSLSFFEEVSSHLRHILEIEPEIVAHDLHPDYLSTRYAQSLKGVRLAPVQHHHAHIASVLAEWGETGPVIGVALDGTGYGADGTVWGGEFLVADLREFRRAGHLAPMPLPGGDAAIEEPWRTAAAYLYAAFGADWDTLPIPFVQRVDRRARLIPAMIDKRVNTPFTSSAGRLFDAMASLLGLCDRNTHEGQAPMELEAAAREGVRTLLPCDIREEARVFLPDPASLVRAAVLRIGEGVPVEVIAAEFHNGFARAVVETCERIRGHERLSTVALSGGVFQNAWLLESVVAELDRKQFRVLTHRQTPPNDGCIALGQVAVARAQCP